MSLYYYEKRTLQKPIATLGADIARHLQLRQHLGKSVIVTETPMATLSATRKQWMRLSRLIQRRRASTLDAEEILRYTRSIMHMQHMGFVAKRPSEEPSAHVYFLTPEEFDELPPHCQTLYLTTADGASLQLITRLPEAALVVDYTEASLQLPADPLPKTTLEKTALKQWKVLKDFIIDHGISINELAANNPLHSLVLDDALDILLGVSHEFLQLCFNFQHALTLAQPLTEISAQQQQIFDIVLRLAHRVHSLTPGSLNQHIADGFGNNDSYFLRDRASEINDIIDHFELVDRPYLPFETVTIEE